MNTSLRAYSYNIYSGDWDKLDASFVHWLLVASARSKNSSILCRIHLKTRMIRDKVHRQHVLECNLSELIPFFARLNVEYNSSTDFVYIASASSGLWYFSNSIANSAIDHAHFALFSISWMKFLSSYRCFWEVKSKITGRYLICPESVSFIDSEFFLSGEGSNPTFD